MLDDVDATSFAWTFMAFMREMQVMAAEPSPSRLAAAISAHLGTEVTGLPVVEQVFALSDHPNLQLALERIAGESGDSELFGLPVDVLHWTGSVLPTWRRLGRTVPGSSRSHPRTSMFPSTSTARCRVCPSVYGCCAMTRYPLWF